MKVSILCGVLKERKRKIRNQRTMSEGQEEEVPAEVRQGRNMGDM